MAVDPATLGAISSVVGTGVNAFVQSRFNREERIQEQKRYERGRKDSLSDFHLENEYNSPSAQMKRLKDAGLNPNLVYGKGATQAAATVNSSSPSSINANPPQFDIGSTMSSYVDTKVKQAQIDNLHSQNETQKQETLLKAAQTLSTIQSTKGTTFDLEQKQSLAATTLEAAKLNVQKLSADIRKTIADTQFTTDSNQRMQELQKPTIAKIASETEKIKADTRLSDQQKKESIARINNMVKDGQLREIEIELRKKGINPSDPAWQRAIQEGIQKINRAFPKVYRDKSGKIVHE